MDRPYRSHLQPACLPCRKRKSRCKQTPGRDACVFCEAHGTVCTYPAKTTRKERRTTSKPAEARDARPLTMGNTSSPDTRINADGDEANTHIVGPVESGDARVLSSFLSDYLSTSTGQTNRAKHVLFTHVRKRPLGFAPPQTASAQQCEIVEKMMEPWLATLVQLFFDKANRAVPLLDRASFLAVYRERRVSPALLVTLYAHTLTYRPADMGGDARYVWNRANEALYSELHVAPGISTLVAILLNVGGRPTTSVMGNTTMLGSAVSLAFALGLNRDARDWAMPAPEKSLRLKLWWALVLHDRWCSLAYGTPPRIRAAQHDVAMPTAADLEPDTGGLVYRALLQLTEVLAQYLEHVYTLGEADKGRLRVLGAALAAWEGSLSTLDPSGTLTRIVTQGAALDHPGAANLRLSYLAVCLLHERVALNEAADDARSFVDVHRAASDICHFVHALEPVQLDDAWLPTSAFTLASAATALLRCALGGEAVDRPATVACVKQYVRDLQKHQAVGWDVADICVAQYAEPVSSLDVDEPVDAGLGAVFDFDTDALDALFPFDDLAGMDDWMSFNC